MAAFIYNYKRQGAFMIIFVTTTGQQPSANYCRIAIYQHHSHLLSSILHFYDYIIALVLKLLTYASFLYDFIVTTLVLISG